MVFGPLHNRWYAERQNFYCADLTKEQRDEHIRRYAVLIKVREDRVDSLSTLSGEDRYKA